MLAACGRSIVGVLWDIHHPCRFFGEAPEATYGALGQYIRHIHLKDSVLQDGMTAYRMMGEGDLPVRTCIELLLQNGFDGFFSLEWVKRWDMELEEPEIVFAQFREYMRQFAGE